MRRKQLMGAVLALLACVAAWAGPATAPFSPTFKGSVDEAMRNPNAAGRATALTDAMANGTNKEVFFVFPLLFPSKVLNAATDARVCNQEIDASTGDIEAYEATAVNQDAYPDDHAQQIRSHMNQLIQCMSQYYANGQLTLPPRS